MASAATYPVDGGMAGKIAHYTVKKQDTLYSIARRFDVGIVAISAANPGVGTWLPKAGTVLTIPTEYVLPLAARKGIVVDLSGLRLFYYPDPQTVVTFPMGIGMKGWQTPTGETTVVRKEAHPVWIVPASIRKEKPEIKPVFPPGPDNPLGQYALHLGWAGYLIHGTNMPYGIGRRSSHGCMRLYPEDIEVLFKAVQTGTPVTVIDRAYELGWEGNRLFLQVTPSQEQTDEIASHEKFVIHDIPDVYGDVHQLAGAGAKIDWAAVRAAVMWRTGIPVVVATRKSAPPQQTER
ncbi:MAG: L,D-transpeptidase family protein [Alphaproteobacteria bacterium]|nr:L,D-transpeptidase family protein [Alphaproteobacteria bacterium]